MKTTDIDVPYNGGILHLTVIEQSPIIMNIAKLPDEFPDQHFEEGIISGKIVDGVFVRDRITVP